MTVPRRETDRSNRSAASGQTGISRSSTSSSGSTTWTEVLRRNPQCVEDRYVKRAKLERYLESKYPGQWQLHVSYGGDTQTAVEKYLQCTDHLRFHSTNRDFGILLRQ